MNKRKRLLEAIVLIADIALTLYTKRRKKDKVGQTGGIMNLK